MNLFVLDEDFYRNAQYHNDKHCNKMILEAAQILSTNTRLLLPNLPDAFCYRVTHPNHPCTVWARQSYSNFRWVYEYGMALVREKVYRTGKSHKSMDVLIRCKNKMAQSTILFPANSQTEHSKCMPEEYITDNVVQSYRNYYMGDKRHLASWTKRGAPLWWK